VKTIDTALLATYQSGGPTIAACVRITRTDGAVFRWVGLDRDVTVGDETFEAAPGVNLTSLVSTEGFAVDNAEITVLDTGFEITRADVLAGVWDRARFDIFEVDWKAETPVANVLKSGTLGNFTSKNGAFVCEFRDLRQAMQLTRDTIMQPTCRYMLGDSRCTKTVTVAPWRVTGAITTVGSQFSASDSSRSEADDFFGDGFLTFTSGANAGLTQKVKTYTASTRAFVFWDQFIFPIAIGDTYTATAGCRLRFQEDCVTKFNNAVNFGGEPNKRNPDLLTAPAALSLP
jgi:uncharacterized phage protein (TIGR02218 family)